MQVLTGIITRDAVVNTVKNDKQVVNFSIALNNRYVTGEGEKREETTFVNCAYWRSPNVSKHLSKGTIVEVTGLIGVEAYAGQDGKPKASLKFHTNNINFLGNAKLSEAKEETEGSKSRTRKQSSRKNAVTAEEPQTVAEPVADDLPF